MIANDKKKLACVTSAILVSANPAGTDAADESTVL